MHKGRKGERYILSGTWLSISDFARILHEVTGKKIVKNVVPISMAKIGVPFFKIYSLFTRQHPLYTFQSLQILINGNRRIINDKARMELNYNPRPLQETLADSIAWFKENNYLN